MVESRAVDSNGFRIQRELELLLHAFRVPQQQPARNLIRALAADVRCREVHLGGEARSCGRTDERGPVGAAGERQDSATHVGLGQRSAVEGGGASL